MKSLPSPLREELLWRFGAATPTTLERMVLCLKIEGEDEEAEHFEKYTESARPKSKIEKDLDILIKGLPRMGVPGVTLVNALQGLKVRENEDSALEAIKRLIQTALNYGIAKEQIDELTNHRYVHLEPAEQPSKGNEEKTMSTRPAFRLYRFASVNDLEKGIEATEVLASGDWACDYTDKSILVVQSSVRKYVEALNGAAATSVRLGSQCLDKPSERQAMRAHLTPRLANKHLVTGGRYKIKESSRPFDDETLVGKIGTLLDYSCSTEEASIEAGKRIICIDADRLEALQELKPGSKVTSDFFEGLGEVIDVVMEDGVDGVQEEIYMVELEDGSVERSREGDLTAVKEASNEDTYMFDDGPSVPAMTPGESDKDLVQHQTVARSGIEGEEVLEEATMSDGRRIVLSKEEVPDGKAFQGMVTYFVDIYGVDKELITSDTFYQEQAARSAYDQKAGSESAEGRVTPLENETESPAEAAAGTPLRYEIVTPEEFEQKYPSAMMATKTREQVEEAKERHLTLEVGLLDAAWGTTVMYVGSADADKADTDAEAPKWSCPECGGSDISDVGNSTYKRCLTCQHEFDSAGSQKPEAAIVPERGSSQPSDPAYTPEKQGDTEDNMTDGTVIEAVVFCTVCDEPLSHEERGTWVKTPEGHAHPECAKRGSEKKEAAPTPKPTDTPPEGFMYAWDAQSNSWIQVTKQ